MPTQVQFRRGTTAQNNSFTGAVGEISIDTDKNALRIHDGLVPGGFEQAKVDLTNVSGATNLSLSGITTTNSLSIGSTQVISSARQLQNIVSLDATTTATIESAVSAAPNDFTSLNISGLSTFSGITTHTTSLFGTQASFSGIVTATTFVGALTGTASNVTTNANLTGHVTSVGNAAVLGSFTSLQLLTALTDETGSGSAVFATSPTFTGTVGAAAITATGDIAAANFNSTSDISLKDNIQTIVNPLDKINKLNGVTFNWKENQKPSIGVIAQELEKVLPELVTQGDIKSVNYNGLIGVLIEAVKEQQKQIEELKSIIKNQ